MKKTKSTTGLLAAGLLAVAAQTGLHAGFVQNPSFESNINETWPHYGPIDLWNGGSGVNEKAGPFHNTVTEIPDQSRAGFKQGAGTLGQDISGLTPGKQYWLQFNYDARDSSIKVDITASFNGVDIGKAVNVQPAHTKNLPYYFASFPFTPDVDSGTLLFTVAVTGDSTALFDAVTLVQRDAGNVTVVNPSFEASGDVPADGITTGLIAGWQGAGTYGVNLTGGGQTYADNGTPPDQDHVAVLGDGGALSQVVDGITPGKPYQLSFAYNAKSGTTPHLQVKVGDAVVYEEDVTAVGGAKVYRTKTLNFNATDFSAKITFAQSGSGALLLDDVKVLGETATPLPPLGISPGVAEISPGDKVTLTATVPNTLLVARAVDIKLRSLAPKVARMVGADSDGILVLHFSKGSDGLQTFVMEGLARGSAVLDVVDSAGLKVVDTSTIWVVTSFVKNPSFESAAAPGGVGYGEILGWTGGSGVNSASGPFLDNGGIPDRLQVAFIQGAKTLSQNISGLTPNQNYWLQFSYNARAFGTGWNLDLSVKFAGQELVKIPGIPAVGTAGETSPFWFTNIVFKPSVASGLLEFVAAVQGDATLLLDAVSIVERDPIDLVVQNPSFEASGTIFPGVGYLTGTPMAGWDFSGSGYGVNVPGRDPWFSDNGVNPDQQTVLFMQNAGNVSQTIHGLTAGKKYTIVLWANPRNCCGGAIETTIRVSVDDAVVLEEAIQPVLNPNPYLVRQIGFTAAGADAVLKIEHAPEAGLDRSLVIDNVRVVPDGKVPPIILTHPQSSPLLLVGDSVSLTASAMGTEPLSYQWQFNGTDLPGKTSATLDLTAMTAQQSGRYQLVARNSIGSKASQAAVITVHEKLVGGFNSGVAANGSLLPLGQVDPHYVLVDNPNDSTSSKTYVISNPPDSWLANPDAAQWIGPLADPQADPMPDVGFYKYRLSFDLTGYDPANTFVSGSTATAQGTDDIYLNDQIVSGYRAGSQSGTAVPFVITTGFKTGVNTLDFRVYVTSTRQPAGLLVTDLKVGAQAQSASATLSAKIQDGQVSVAWPVALTGYVLQFSTKLNTGWADDTTPAVQQGNQWVVTEAASGGSTFYRLIKR